MKTFLSLFIVLVLVAVTGSAFASSSGGNAFALYSGASAAVSNSAAMAVRGYKTKTLTASGATLNSNATTQTFKNMSGTILVQCAPTSSGPWSTCVANDYGQTATSKTTNGTFTWSDAAAYIRLQWTAGTVGTKIKAWLNWTE